MFLQAPEVAPAPAALEMLVEVPAEAPAHATAPQVDEVDMPLPDVLSALQVQSRVLLLCFCKTLVCRTNQLSLSPKFQFSRGDTQ